MSLIWEYMEKNGYAMMFDGGVQPSNNAWKIFLQSANQNSFAHCMLAFRRTVYEFITLPDNSKDDSIDLADERLASHLKFLNDNGILQNTMVVILSDRGTEFRRSGKTGVTITEGYNPFLAIMLPSDPTILGETAESNFRRHRLHIITPADLYITFMTLTLTAYNRRKNVPIRRNC
uniref:Sulfatase N-terminal domain-containing protein n=1 Tax=Trichuris muris TaxID=70415 RepID=A0A5S6QV48_TRIMR